MKKLRIFDLLSSIQPIELKRFRKYMESDSLFNSRDYIPLVDTLLKFYPDFDNKELTMELLYSSLYPGKKYNNRVIISRLSELNRMAENFILTIKLEQDHTLRSRILAEALMHRKTYETFDLLIARALNNEMNNKKISERQLFELDQLFMIKGQCLIDREKFVEAHELLEQNIEVFLIYLMTRLLTMYCGIKNIENFQIAGTSVKTLDAVIKNMNVEGLAKTLKGNRLSAYLKVMLQIYKLYDRKVNDTAYYRAKKEFLGNIETFEQISKFTIFSFLYSYTVTQINNRRLEFAKEIYDILKLIIKHDAYKKAANEYMPSMLFREIVLTGLKHNDVKGTEKFIEDYSGNLAPAYKETMKLYCFGKINMHNRMYSKALKYYDNCPKNIRILSLDIRVDTLLCLFELGLVDRFRDEISRNNTLLAGSKNITVFQRNSFMHYNSIMEKLMKAKLEPSAYSKTKLLKEVQSKKILHYKEWIISKIEKNN